MPIPFVLFYLLQSPPRRTPAVKPPARPAVTTAMELSVKTSSGEKRTATNAKQTPLGSRPLAMVKPGEIPSIRFLIRNGDPKKPVGSVIVHFLITRQLEAGAPIAPGLQKGSYQDSVLGTELAPGESTSGEYNTGLYDPGDYLVEVELLDEQGKRLQYCALDLKVDSTP